MLFRLIPRSAVPELSAQPVEPVAWFAKTELPQTLRQKIAWDSCFAILFYLGGEFLAKKVISSSRLYQKLFSPACVFFIQLCCYSTLPHNYIRSSSHGCRAAPDVIIILSYICLSRIFLMYHRCITDVSSNRKTPKSIGEFFSKVVFLQFNLMTAK